MTSSSLEGTSKTFALIGEAGAGVLDGDLLGTFLSFFGSAGPILGDLDSSNSLEFFSSV